MRNKAFLATVSFCLSAGGLFSCQNGGSVTAVNLLFGRLYDASLDFSSNLTALGWSSLSGLIKKKDTFVLFVGDDDSTCTCFAKFKSSLTSYLKTSNAYLYAINPSEFDGEGKDTFSLKVSASEGYETIAIFEDGVLKYQRQRSGSDDSWSNDVSSFKDWMAARIRVSDMLYVNKTQLDSLSPDVPYVRGFLRASCPDCSFVESDFLKTYNLTAHARSYVIDADAVGLRYGDDGKYDATQWQNYKNAHGLSESGSPDFGFGLGYVPTWQFISNGEIADADVYVNDSVTKNEDGTFRISDTYWDGSRSHDFFDFLNKDTVRDFTQLSALQTIPSDDIDATTYGDATYYSWKHEAAAKYHDPLLKGFFDHYLSLT